ncbi:MAG: hypothetical protein LLG16_08755 [Euryarchaeota archaeon]|nr:hypothetical protein [Euryarchaeota archaeon]
METAEYGFDFLSEMKIKTMRRARKTLIYWLSAFLLAIIIVYVGMIIGCSLDDILRFLTQIVGTYCFFIALSMIGLLRDLKFILANELKLRYVIKMELFPSMGEGIKERMLMKLTELYPTLVSQDKRRVRFDSQLTKASKVRMDIIADLKDETLDTSEILIVKIYEKGEVGTEELREVSSAIFRFRALHILSEIELVMLVSMDGFSLEAVEHVRTNKVPGLHWATTRLIVPKEQTFTVII